MKKTAHITYRGEPICQKQYPASPAFQQQCEYPSISKANDAARKMRVNAAWGTIKVVVGECPVFKAEGGTQLSLRTDQQKTKV